MRIREAGSHDGKKARKFQFKIRTTKRRTVKNMSFGKVRNSLVISFAESSITEEEFPILKEEYESEE